MVSTGDRAASGGGLRRGRQREQRTTGGLAIALAETGQVSMPTCAGKQVEAHPRIQPTEAAHDSVEAVLREARIVDPGQRELADAT